MIRNVVVACVAVMLTTACIPTVMANEEANTALFDAALSNVAMGGTSAAVMSDIARCSGSPTCRETIIDVTPENKFNQFTFLPSVEGCGVHVPWNSFITYDNRDGSVYVATMGDSVHNFLYPEQPVVDVRSYRPQGVSIPQVFEVPDDTTISFSSDGTAVLTYGHTSATLWCFDVLKLTIKRADGSWIW